MTFGTQIIDPEGIFKKKWDKKGHFRAQMDHKYTWTVKSGQELP